MQLIFLSVRCPYFYIFSENQSASNADSAEASNQVSRPNEQSTNERSQYGNLENIIEQLLQPVEGKNLI